MSDRNNNDSMWIMAVDICDLADITCLFLLQNFFKKNVLACSIALGYLMALLGFVEKNPI